MLIKLPSNVEEFVDTKKSIASCEMVIDYAKKLGATDVSVNLDKGLGLSVTVRENELETLEFDNDAGLDITLYYGTKKASASTSVLTEKNIKHTIETTLAVAKKMQEDDCAGLADASLMSKNHLELDLYQPSKLSIEECIELAKECEEAGLSSSDKIINTEGASIICSQDFSVWANSNGFIGYYPTSESFISCHLVAGYKEQMEADIYYDLGINDNCLSDVKRIGKLAASRAVARLNAQKIDTCDAPVLFVPDTAKSLFKCFMAGISGGKVWRRSSFLMDRVGDKIFSDSVNIREEPHILGSLYSAPFDLEGVATYAKDFVKDGILEQYLLSSYSARKLNLKTTANSGGMHNLIVSHSDKTYKDLIKEMDTGLIVTEFLGDGSNLVTGDYSRGVAGFWVEAGEIKYPVSEVTIAGNLIDMYKNIVAIGNDVDNRSIVKTGSVLIESMKIAGN